MIIHSRARTTPLSRAVLVERVGSGGFSAKTAALLAGVSTRTAYKWLARYRAEGQAGLQDRPSVPERMPRRSGPEREALIVLLRQCRMSGPAIARQLEMARSTVARVLEREGLGRLRSPQSVVRRYERAHPGELIHLDIKKLVRFRRAGHRMTGDRSHQSRGAGWEYVHIAIDDASRIAYAEVLSDEKGATCAGFLRRVLTYYRRLGIQPERLLTDNGVGYISDVFKSTCAREHVAHWRTQPYRPCTNGKAERFIQTMLREWAYARPFRHSRDRKQALSAWLVYYNRWRPHGSLAGAAPLTRIDTPLNNVSGNYI